MPSPCLLYTSTMTVKCGMLREMIEKTIYAVSQDDKKPAHTGELFVIEPGSLTIVALDGYRLATVSYTHLDVYKRQVSMSPPTPSPIRQAMKFRPLRSATASTSVSYTHLDVYKRQL